MAPDTRLLVTEDLMEEGHSNNDVTDTTDTAYPRCSETSLCLAVRAARTHEDSLSGYLRHVLIVFKQSSISIVVRTVLAMVAIVIFVIGLLRFRRCSYEPEIPLFLVLAGAAIILKSFIHVLKFCHHRQADEGERSTLDTCSDITTLFLVLWVLTGSVWVFGAYSHVIQGSGLVTEEIPESKDFCDLFVYMTALWFILSVLCCLFIIFLIMFILSLYYCSRKT